MLNTLPELRDLLKGSPLADRQMVELPIPQSPATALAIETNLQTYLEDWRWLRRCLRQTERWPLVAQTASRIQLDVSWSQNLQQADLFSRWDYQCESDGKKGRDVAPAALIARAKGFDPLPSLRRFADRSNSEDPVEFVETQIYHTTHRFGRAPEATEVEALIAQGVIKTITELERWFFAWEQREFGLAAATAEVEDDYQAWLESPDNDMALILPPTPNGWDTLAYIHWYAAGEDTETAISLLRSWHTRYGAELVAHSGTDLQFFVARQPTTLDEAFQLAWEQQAIAECTTILPGVCLRDHARALMRSDRRLLFEAP
jgi:hypothetical protein